MLTQIYVICTALNEWNKKKLLVKKNYYISIDDFADSCIDSQVKSLFTELVNDSAFVRLGKINFLGAINYKSNYRTKGIATRYQHSLGVAKLALEYSKLSNLPSKDTKLLLASALLHDIGHAPLSHSMEPAFKEIFDINHHKAAESILKGSAPIGKSLYKLLESHGITSEEVIELVDRKSTASYAFLFNSPINIDTIDGILRAQALLNCNQTLSPLTVLKSLIDTNIDNVFNLDLFWNAKDFVYKHIIFSPKFSNADKTSQEYLRSNPDEFTRECFYKTEEQLKKSVPRLFNLINQSASKLNVETKSLKSRRFVIYGHIKTGSPNFLEERYKEIKEEKTLISCTKHVFSYKTNYQQKKLWRDDDITKFNKKRTSIFA